MVDSSGNLVTDLEKLSGRDHRSCYSRNVLDPRGWSSVHFWKDNWLLNEPLHELSMVHISEPVSEARACDLWQNGTGLLLLVIEPYMSLHNRLRLASVVIDDVTGARDR